MAAYSTRIITEDGRNRLVRSAGVYAEIGRDRFVVDEKLRKRTAGTVAAAARLGLERKDMRFVWRTQGLYLTGIAGISVGRDPNQLGVTPYLRAGLAVNTMFALRSLQ